MSYTISKVPEIVSIIVSFASPSDTYEVNKTWMQETLRAIPQKRKQRMLRVAVIKNYVSLVKRLMDSLNPTGLVNIACYYNHHQCLEILLKDPRIVPSSEHLEKACLFGHVESVRILLKDGRAASDLTKAIDTAKRCKHVGILELFELFQ